MNISRSFIPLPVIRIITLFLFLFVSLQHTGAQINSQVEFIKQPEKEIQVIQINFEKLFPYKIQGWKEAYGNNEVTTARISNTISTDYWNHNHSEDEVMREELQLK